MGSRRVPLKLSILRIRMTLLLVTLLPIGIWVSSSIAGECDTCISCHGDPENVHQGLSHAAAPPSAQVTLFADNGHAVDGRTGTKPYFAIQVDCGTCHNNDLPVMHGNDCTTCHPTPYDTLGIWGKGCQQGGCHSFYHQDSIQAHLPYDSLEDPSNLCSNCHVEGGDGSFEVPQTKCLNCHAAFTPGDLSPPETTSNAQSVYYGPAKIDFSITDNGKIGVGRTFYRLDGGDLTGGSYVLVIDPGAHELEFWSIDQYGNIESAPNYASFSIIEDTTPPATTSNAKDSYTQGATITLTATDDSPQGVKTTYYRINDGAIQSGTTVVIPATDGTYTYTLIFWSEDWAGNVESSKSVTFTVTSGSGTLRLVALDSDINGSVCFSYPTAKARWVVTKGGWSGVEVATGSGTCSDWDGVDDIPVPVSTTPYYISIEWWNVFEEYWNETGFPNVYITTPGEVVRLAY